jgi:AcrR family transcriptional regulator
MTIELPAAPRRIPLNRERILRAAIDVADREGLRGLTMRRLGQELAVEAMSLYNHVRNKDDVLDGIVDLVVADIEVPPAGTDWRAAMRMRAQSAHTVLLSHPWAALQIMSRFNIGPGMTRYLEQTLGRLREGGFSIEGALDAWNALDSHIYGFTLQELSLPFEVSETQRVSEEFLAQMPTDQFPHLAEVVGRIAETGRAEDFEFGLDLILEGLERQLRRGGGG